MKGQRDKASAEFTYAGPETPGKNSMLFLTSLAYYITSTFYMKSSGSHSYYTFVIFPSLHLHLRHSYTDVNSCSTPPCRRTDCGPARAASSPSATRWPPPDPRGHAGHVPGTSTARYTCSQTQSCRQHR